MVRMNLQLNNFQIDVGVIGRNGDQVHFRDHML